MKQTLTAMCIAIVLISCSNSNRKTKEKEQMETSKEMNNKEKAVAVLNSLETGDKTAINYINPTKYVQHNLAVADGLEGFGAVLQNAPPSGFKANVVRAFEDGDYVFTHTIYDFFGPKVGFDIFKFEDGQIVEHWDNLAEITPPNPSNRTQTDGETQIADGAHTLKNKAVVQSFIKTVLIDGQFDKMNEYFDGDNYLQHNAMIGDGLSGLGTALEEMAKKGIHMVYNKNHIVLAEGNFVLAVSEGSFADKHTSFYDLFRIDDGKIAEHWDIIETILPRSEHKNNNGKFNF